MNANTPHYFHYWAAPGSINTGQWFDQSEQYVFPKGEELGEVNPFIRKLVFAYSIAKLSQFQADFHASMKKSGWKVTLQIQGSDTVFKIEASKGNTPAASGQDSEIDSLDADIKAALADCQKKGDFSASDKWTLSTPDAPAKRIDSPHRDAIAY